MERTDQGPDPSGPEAAPDTEPTPAPAQDTGSHTDVTPTNLGDVAFKGSTDRADRHSRDIPDDSGGSDDE